MFVLRKKSKPQLAKIMLNKIVEKVNGKEKSEENSNKRRKRKLFSSYIQKNK